MKKKISPITTKNSNFTGHLFIAVFLLIGIANQIVFKVIALGPGGSSHLALIFEPFFYLCGVLLIAQAAVWLAVLRRLPLSYAYPFTSIAVITLLASGAIFFGESITVNNVIGALIIMGGLVVLTGSNEKVDTVNRDHI